MSLSAAVTRFLPTTRDQRLRLLGGLLVLGSAFFFYLATAIIHWGAQNHVPVGSEMYTFGRFVFGFGVVSLSMLLHRKAPKTTHMEYILARMVTNTIAVYAFFKAVEVGTVAEGNILNMTYPLFVALFSWFMLKQERDVPSLFVVALSFVGIWLILAPPAGAHFSLLHDSWGLMSGFFAAFAIITLDLARKYNDAETILFYLFGLGAVLLLPFVVKDLALMNMKAVWYILICSIAGVAGQYMLTYGFFYVTAVEGAVLSSTRILIAALLGPLLVSDPPLGVAGWLGALIIFGCDVALAVRHPKTAKHHAD